MGTSTSSKGASNNSPLVPPWADTDGAGPGPTPDPNRFQGFRTSLGRFVSSGDRSYLDKALNRYARTTTGGAATGPRRFGAMAQSGADLYETLNQLRSDPARAPLNLQSLSGRSTREAIDAIVDSLVPQNGDADRIRTALNEALSKCLDGTGIFDASIITDDLLMQMMVEYMTICVFEQVVMDSNRAFNKAGSTNGYQAAETALYELVKDVTDRHMTPLLRGQIGFMTRAQMQSTQIAAVREVWREWEGLGDD